MHVRSRRAIALGRSQRRPRVAPWAAGGGQGRATLAVAGAWDDVEVAERYAAAFVLSAAGGPPDSLPAVYPALVVLSGLPGCGKSHFARQLAARAAIAVISSDRVRQVLYARPTYSEAEHGIVHAVCCRLVARALSQGRAVVLDATNLRAARRHLYHDLARAHDIPCHLVAIEGREADVRARLRRRAAGLANDGSAADERVYERMLRQLDPITEPHLHVDSSGDVGPAAAMLVALLRRGAAHPAPDRVQRQPGRVPGHLATAAAG